MRQTIGPYRVIQKLGEGGMGVVYAARDSRLDRDVAIKLVHENAADQHARERLRREARAAAGLNHPNICQLYDVGEESGDPYIVMELLSGESLAQRMKRGAMPVSEAVPIVLAVLNALQALHRRQIIHRDLKPSNVFLTADGVKLLDFGLARVIQTAPGGDGTTMIAEEQLTKTGAVVGTPHYMSPEQVLGRPLDARSDLFSTGSVLFQMIAGRTPFESDAVMSILHAIAYDQVPVLTGSHAIAAVDRIIHRAMSKRVDDRYESAAAMAEALREVLQFPESGGSAVARPMTRLVVLPFRMLRADPEIDFLSLSLADAITSSLSGLESLVVRSTIAAARYAGESLDLKTIAREAEVDVVLSGTLLRGGEHLRVNTQLIEVPGGAVLWSQSSQVTLRDIFQVEDELTRRIVEALALPLTEREHRLLNRDVPANARAYEYYLRGARQRHAPEEWMVARDLYQRAVEEDPQYAPAWARLARAHFLVGKYTAESGDHLNLAERAVRRALDLNPELPSAQHVDSLLELERGRSVSALERLLTSAARLSSDPELFAALVHVTRYCGLLDASLAAHERARRLDPQVRTSVTHTHFMLGDYDRALAAVDRDIGYIDCLIPLMLGRDDEALEQLRQRESGTGDRRLLLWLAHLRATIEGRAADALPLLRELLGTLVDPEARFYCARCLVRNGAHDEALEVLAGVVARGYCCYPAFTNDPWLDPLRASARFKAIVADARRGSEQAHERFVKLGGERLLGVR
jgi:serine/threonine-protein kinase